MKSIQMGHAARLIGNSTWNGMAFLVEAGLNLLTLPYIISHLGISEFGLAGLIIACVAPALIFSGTLNQVTTRELAQHLTADSQKEGKRVFATALFLAVMVGAIIFVVLLLTGPWLATRLFNLDASDVKHITQTFTYGGLGWLFRCLAGVFLALFAAKQDYARLAMVSISGSLTSALMIWLLVPLWPEAATYLACLATGYAVTLLLAFWLSFCSLQRWLSWPMLCSQPLYRLFRVGSWQLAAQFGGMAGGQADRYMLGTFFQTRHVGYYNVAQRLEEAIYIGILKIGEVLFPLFSTMLKEHEERQADVLFRTSWILNLIAVCVLGGIIPISGSLLQLWTNGEVASEGERLLVVLALAGILGCGANVFSFYLLGHGKTRTNAFISLVTATAITVASGLSLPLLGWQAAGWSTLIGMAVKIIVIAVLMRRSFCLQDISARITHFVLAPLIAGASAALIMRQVFVSSISVGMAWWEVAGWYSVNVAVIACTIIIVARLGPYGQVCWRDLHRIGVCLLFLRKN